ncbi:MAG: hypothetical protein H7X93_12315 [Sphingomonadaceae bacterium]|nr:hypothetical protein [Sphingomonadaceae bacterium]
MTNVYSTPDKVARKWQLFRIGEEALEKEGWEVSRVPGSGKASLRRIARNGESKFVSIRTTQDTYIAFPRNPDDSAWVTLDVVDAVVAVSVDDSVNPRFAQVHMIDGDEMRDRFDRSYAARKAAGHSIPTGRGMWLGLYVPDLKEPPTQVGAGAGLDHPPIARVPLKPEGSSDVEGVVGQSIKAAVEENVEPVLTIADARRRLAAAFDVDPTNVKISIEV